MLFVQLRIARHQRFEAVRCFEREVLADRTTGRVADEMCGIDL
jgi:hypothetical protein